MCLAHLESCGFSWNQVPGEQEFWWASGSEIYVKNNAWHEQGLHWKHRFCIWVDKGMGLERDGPGVTL